MLGETAKEDLCQISLTGIRSLVLLGFLIKSPMSLEEIKKAYIKCNIMEDSNSCDIIRIDINTLRDAGCRISRADKRTDNKFVLLDHPFKIDMTEKEAGVIKQAFNRIKEKSDISVLILYDNLFKKIAPHISDKNVQDILLSISPLKKYSFEIIDRLKEACEQKELVRLLYKAPTVKEETEKEVYADRLVLQNDKLYFYGVDKGSDKPIYLNVKRILRLLSQQKDDDYHKAEPLNVKFFLREFGISGLQDNEKIESGNMTDGFIICGQYHNSFYAIQRILSFGSRCRVLEPENIRTKVVEIIKKMREVYNA